VNRPLAGQLLLPVLLLAAACTATDPEPAPGDPAAAPFADCAALTVPPAASGAPPAGGGEALPEVELPCFTGGAGVRLADLRGPAVVNFWASWCGPCRKELPAFQRLAQRTAGSVHVVGVDTTDRRSDAASLGEELGVTFANLFDERGTARHQLAGLPSAGGSGAVAGNGLPLTLLVDGQGRIRHLDSSGALDDATLTGLVERHLAVAVPR
jgi:thiol-disulfide isomerase/thioredoxin